MKLLTSKNIPLPIIYLINNRKEVESLPIGIPFIIGSDRAYDSYVKLLEFEVLYKTAIESGLPFNWIEILKKNGYTNLYERVAISFYCEDEMSYYDVDARSFIEDASYKVNLEYLKNLKLIPTWFSDIENNIKENILNTILYNPNLYNKKLDIVSGGVDLTSPDKNLIIIDISGSIPKSISKSILLLAKTMTTSYYADLLITGSKSTLYDYSEVESLNVEQVYEENGTDNDQIHFMNLLATYRKYNNVISFGDNHSPRMTWRNSYNKRTKLISIETGRELCKWVVNKIYSFHTTSSEVITGYAELFNTKNIEYMKNWVDNFRNY